MKKVQFFLTLIFIFLSPTLTNAQNNALNFDGIDDRVDLNLLDFTSNDQISISVWVKPALINNLQNVIEIADLNGHAIWLNTNGGFYGSSVFATSGWTKVESPNSVLTANKWYHLAYTYDGINQNIYLNGVLMATNPISQQFANSPSGNTSISDDSGVFKGAIDEIRIWSYARSKAEIRASMYKELVGNETNLVAYFNSNANSGVSLVDNSVNSNTGTLINMAGTEWSPSAAFFGPKRAMQFITDDYVTIPSTFGLASTSTSAECWVNLPSTSEKGAFVHLGNHDVGYGIGVGSTLWDNLGNELIVLYDLVRWIPTGVNIGTGWHHVAFTVDGVGNCTVFLDGVSVFSEVGDPIDPIIPSGNSSIASSQNLTRVLTNGTIDEVRVWNDIRTESEIRENMYKTLLGTEANLVAYYNLDTKDVADVTVGGNDGIITGDGDESVNSTAFNTWLNTNNTSWTTATNWSNGIPVSTDNVGIYNYSGSSPILSGTPTVNNLIIGTSANITLSSNLTVNGNLFLYDNLDLNGQTITFGSTSTLFEDTGLISGNTGTITTTRNFSSVNENVAGFGITLNAGYMGSTVVSRGHTVQTGAINNSVKRYFDITPTSDAELNATVTFNYDDSELNGLNEANLKLFQSTDGGSSWVNKGGTINTVNNTISVSYNNSIGGRWTAAEDLTLSVEENVIDGFNMYPNPAEKTLILTAKEEIKHVEIFNLLGQQQIKKLINSKHTYLDLSLLPTGNYIIKIYTESAVKSVKFVLM